MKGHALCFLTLCCLGLGMFVARLANTNAFIGAENYRLEQRNRDLRIQLDALELELYRKKQAFLAETLSPRTPAEDSATEPTEVIQ